MDDIVRTRVSKREKVLEYSYLGLIGLGPLGTSLLEDLGVGSFWIRLSLFVLFMIIVLVFLAFISARIERQRLAADRQIGVFTCAVRFPSSTPGSLGDLWDEGAARVSGDGLAFQPQQGPFHAKPAGMKREFGRFCRARSGEDDRKQTSRMGSRLVHSGTSDRCRQDRSRCIIEELGTHRRTLEPRTSRKVVT